MSCKTLASTEINLWVTTRQYGGIFYPKDVQCKNYTDLEPCPLGHYCPNSNDTYPCKAGYYCGLAFGEPRACTFNLLGCPYDLMTTPMPGVVFIVLLLLWFFSMSVFYFYSTWKAKEAVSTADKEVSELETARIMQNLATGIKK